MALWIQASRPKTLMAIISPVLIGTTLALSDGFFEPLLFFLTLCTGLGIQITTNLANDYYDWVKGADTEKRVGPTRATAAGLITPDRMKRAIVLMCVVTAALGLYLILKGGVIFALLLAIALLLSVLYTAGPFPISYLGLGDLFVLVFYGPVAVSATHYLQTHTLTTESLIVGLAPSSLATAILVANNLRDVETDTTAKKKTLLVRFGRTFGKWEYTGLVLGAIALPLIYLREHPFAFLSAGSILLAIPLIAQVFKSSRPHDFIPLLPKTAQLMFFYTFLFCIGWML